MASSSLQQMAGPLITRAKTLINNDLKKICKEEGVASSGNKALLQNRIISLIDSAVFKNDHAAFNRLQHRVANRGAAPPMDSMSSFGAYTPTHSSPTLTNGHATTNGYQHTYSGGFQQSSQLHRPQYFFKESPFFEIRELVLGSITLEASPSHRQNTTRSLTLNDHISARMKSDSSLRLLLFSAMEQPLAPFTRLDIAFPGQIEVRLNGDEVKANYKGLKNKPGSTRPADLTNYVRINPAHYRNSLLITYALTQKASEVEKYNLFIYMVRKFSIEDLTRRIRTQNVITKHSVLNEMKKKANDPDIVVESSVMSLKDPISTLKMTTPCRSTVCTHNRCFDAESFLQLQEQAPTWQCPICNKTVSFEALAVDEYVQEILNTVSRDTDQVTIEPDGQWSTDKEPPTSSNQNGYGGYGGYGGFGGHDESDDDLVEISDFRLSTIKSEAAPTPQSLMQTPPLLSREASTAPRTGSKRTSEVIDLTLSDEEEPVRPTKKVAYSTPSRLHDSSHRYALSSYGNSSAPMHSQSHLSHSMPSSLRMDPPPTHHRHSYGEYHPPPQHTFPGQGSPTYPAYIGSSP